MGFTGFFSILPKAARRICWARDAERSQILMMHSLQELLSTVDNNLVSLKVVSYPINGCRPSIKYQILYQDLILLVYLYILTNCNDPSTKQHTVDDL
jgi:hypothetical protein